jgi:hypothetical protein
VSIFVVHQGLGFDGQLYYNTFDGETWAGTSKCRTSA